MKFIIIEVEDSDSKAIKRIKRSLCHRNSEIKVDITGICSGGITYIVPETLYNRKRFFILESEYL